MNLQEKKICLREALFPPFVKAKNQHQNLKNTLNKKDAKYKTFNFVYLFKKIILGVKIAGFFFKNFFCHPYSIAIYKLLFSRIPEMSSYVTPVIKQNKVFYPCYPLKMQPLLINVEDKGSQNIRYPR